MHENAKKNGIRLRMSFFFTIFVPEFENIIMRKTFLVILVGLLSAVCAQAETVYTKVSGKPVNDWPGTYIIVYEKSDTKALVWDGEESSGNYQEVTLSDGKITSEALADYQITVSKEGSNEYYVKAKNGYIGCGGGKNEITFTSGGHSCTIKSNGGYVQLETNTNTCRFLFNEKSGTNRFRFYYDKDKKWTDSQLHNVCFYALGEIDQEEQGNKLDINYAHVEMYACESKFPTQSNPYDQYFMTFMYLAQEESDDAVPQIGLEILAPTQYSIEGTYKSDYTPGVKYFINCQAGSKHSYFIFPSKAETGRSEASIKLAEMKVTKVAPSSQPNAYVYHIKLVMTDSNQKIWTLDKDMDVYAWWIDCNKTTNPVSNMDPVAFTLESGNHNPSQGIENLQTEVSVQKILIDGQMYILRGEKIYSVQGQMVR